MGENSVFYENNIRYLGQRMNDIYGEGRAHLSEHESLEDEGGDCCVKTEHGTIIFIM